MTGVTQNIADARESAKLPWFYVSYSSLNTFSFCPRKFEFNKVWAQGKTIYRDDDSIPSAVGRGFHEGYQSYVANQDHDLAVWKLLQNYPWELALYAQRNTRKWDVVLNSFLIAMDQFKLSQYEIVRFKKTNATGEEDEVDCVEVPFELRFLNTAIPGYQGIAFIGYIDLILRNKINGRIITTDIKTHQRPLNTRTAEFQYNTQQVPYGIIVEHLLGKKIESFDVLYLDCQLSLEDDCHFQEYTYTKDQVAVEEWIAARLFQFRAIKQMLETNLFTRRESGCVSFNHPCKYLDICRTRDKKVIGKWFDEFDDSLRDWSPWVVADLDLGVAL